MTKETLTLPELAEASFLSVENYRRIVGTTEFRSIFGDEETDERRIRYNRRKAIIMMIGTDCVRSGKMKAPQAGRTAGRIAECLAFDPDAAQVHVEFRQNGASFTFTSDDAPDATVAAGPARFRITFDLNAYRAAVDTAMGVDDVE